MPKSKAKGTKVTLKMAKKALRTTIEGRRRLSLSNMGLVVFPKSILKLGPIHELDLSRNQIQKLPDDIGVMRSLRVLDLHSNKLELVPDTLGSLVQLEDLNLSNNRLRALPESLGALSLLRVLNAGLNNLDSLPASMQKLESLEELGLFHNQFRTLPESVEGLRNLRRTPVWCSQDQKSERGQVYLVHEKNLCKSCQHQLGPIRATRGGDDSNATKVRSRTFTGLFTPNSVAKTDQNWRIRDIS